MCFSFTNKTLTHKNLVAAKNRWVARRTLPVLTPNQFLYCHNRFFSWKSNRKTSCLHRLSCVWLRNIHPTYCAVKFKLGPYRNIMIVSIFQPFLKSAIRNCRLKSRRLCPRLSVDYLKKMSVSQATQSQNEGRPVNDEMEVTWKKSVVTWSHVIYQDLHGRNEANQTNNH